MTHPFSKRAIKIAIQAVADDLPSDVVYAEGALSAALAVGGVAPQSWHPIETVPNTAVLLFSHVSTLKPSIFRIFFSAAF